MPYQHAFVSNYHNDPPGGVDIYAQPTKDYELHQSSDPFDPDDADGLYSSHHGEFQYSSPSPVQRSSGLADRYDLHFTDDYLSSLRDTTHSYHQDDVLRNGSYADEIPVRISSQQHGPQTLPFGKDERCHTPSSLQWRRPNAIQATHDYVMEHGYESTEFRGDQLLLRTSSQHIDSFGHTHSSHQRRNADASEKAVNTARKSLMLHGEPYQQHHPRNDAYIDYYDSDRAEDYTDTVSPNPASEHDHAFPEKHGVQLKPVSALPDIYRSIFKFGVFNAIQTKCFNSIMNSDENIVISAPTGSGKTVLFELAMIRILMNDRAGRSKCVYMAPTKALCAERARDWATKFEGIGVKCCELTGDTAQFGSSAWGDARHASIIVTTGEKWDSLTRHWSESAYILDRIKLFMVDEVHILNESRGGTLEVVVSRMKNRGTQVRFMMVSATVPNIVDIANWVGCATSDQPCHGPAEIFEFDESFRPCKITRVVKAFQRPQNMNDFAFAKILDAKLFNVLQEHSRKKPILIFVATRKGVLATAERLLADYSNALGKGLDVPWLKPKSCDRMFDDKRLERLALYGIGVHHAGISMSDRRATEELFLNKFLNVVVATSTLAVGVNLPAHTVVIRGVKVYHNNTCQEYSDLDVMQMIGRAGRPQFDNEGLAIIMCEQQLESKYQALAQGKTLLESCLHLNLCEHINSEIGLGTITDIRGARKWLKDSFLFQRIQRNPCYYHIGKNAEETWENKFDRLVDETVKRLGDHELLQTPGDADGDESRLRLTEYGEIMSKLYIRLATMSLILKLPDRASLRDMLEVIASADELNDLKLRAGEKQVYIKLRTDDGVRFKLSKIEKPGDKIFILMQAVLGGVYLNSPEYRTADSQPYLESTTIFRHAPRIAKGIVEVAVIKKSATQLLHGLELVRCLTAKTWEDRPTVLRQIESIGEKSLKTLAEHGVTSLDVLRKQDPLRIEILLNRRPPYGQEILESCKEIPTYRLEISEVEIRTKDGRGPVHVKLKVDCGRILHEGTGSNHSRLKKARHRSDKTCILTMTSDHQFLDFRTIPTKLLQGSKSFTVIASLIKPSQSVIISITSESVAGNGVTRTYKPEIDPKQYPILDTRPQTSAEMDLVGLEDDPDFWNFGPDDGEDCPKNTLALHQVPSTPSRYLIRRNIDVQDSVAAPSHPKLSNGNYACNHTCRDKATCRHLCCRDGLGKPPHTPKRRHNSSKEENAQARSKSRKDNTAVVPRQKPSDDFTHVVKTVHKVAPATKSSAKLDARLNQLDKLHSDANVRGSLRLFGDQRLKLEDVESSVGSQRPGKHRPAPSFDVELADISSESCTVTGSHSDDDVEFPDVHELFRVARNSDQKNVGQELGTSSESSYSNPEMDALIRDMDLPKDSLLYECADERDLEPASTSAESSLKRSYEDEAYDWPAKRYKEGSDELLNTKPDQTQQQPPSKADSLFLRGSSPDSHRTDRERATARTLDNGDVEALHSQFDFGDPDTGFEFDMTLFDFVPEDSAATSLSGDQLHNTYSLNDGHQGHVARDESGSQDHEDYYTDNPLAEIEAFLNSGSVEITDD